ncbi:MAG TPA: T9SS type A sorting domain-containing protein, partial [Bacteroidia bacterium]|nr:T9SS type A sorting domain-containing protein [Bacteroidia bacterium]
SLTPDQSSVYVLYPAGLIGATSLILKKYTATNGTLAAGWSASGVTISTGPNVYPEINHDLSLFTDNSNNALIVWVEARYTGNGEIYMQQVNPSGTALLAANGEYLFGDTTSGANGVDYVQVIQEADKNLLIAYNNLITFNDVAAMKVKPNGTILWNDSLTTSGGKSAYPYPALDGKNGVYLFYVNTNSPEKLYALAIDSNGAKYKGWTVPGSLFGTMSDYDGFNPNYDVNATETNPTEAVVAWNRQVGKLFIIYTCNLLSNGNNCQNPNGINEISNTADTYTLFPNPANANVTVRSSSYEGNKTVTIYNIVGQEINTIESSMKEVVINTSQLSPGMYFVTIKEVATNRNYTLKLIKK